MRTPVFTIVARSAVATLAYTRASAQGLDFWQSLRETANATTPVYHRLFDTEISAIERGEIRPYNPANAKF